MTTAQVIMIALQISVALIVFSVALQARSGDITYLLRRPSLLVRSVLAMNVVMPILAALIAGLFKLRPQLEVALILLAVAPVPPILPGKQGKAGGNVSYGIGLLAIASTLAIVFVPASVTLIGRLFGHDLHVPMATIATVVAKSVLVPVIAGALVRRVAPAFAERVARPVYIVALLVTVLGLVLVLAKMWPAIMAQIGDYTVVAIVVFTLAGLAVGHLLGGPDPDDRTVLGLSTACRHPGVAVATAGAIATDPKAVPEVVATVFLCVLTAVVITIPYVAWSKRRHAATASSAGSLAR